MSKKNIILPDEEEIILNALHNGIHSDEELWSFNVALTDHIIPYRSICEEEGHVSPWHLFSDTFFQRYQVGAAIGPRGGGKTDLVSRVIAQMMIAYPGIELACVAAVQRQADRCSGYVQKWLSNRIINKLGLLTKLNQREKHLSNGSKYDQLVGTVAGSNSPHPNILFCDEVDLMNPAALEELKMVPMTSCGIKAQMLQISSRKSAMGPMQKLIDDAANIGTKTYIWCWKEVSEPCPDWRSGTKTTIYEGIHPHTKQPILFEAFDKCSKCPLLWECRGDIKKSTGWIPIDDAIREFKTTDTDTWRNQKCCVKPRTGVGIYVEFSIDDHVDEVPYDPDRPTDLVWDWGTGGADTVCLFIQEDPLNPNNYVHIPFEYRDVKGAPTRTHAEIVRDICKTYGIIPRRILSDSAAVQQILDIKDFDANFYGQVRPVPKQAIDETIPLVKRLLRKVTGDIGLKIDASCTGTIKEFMNWERDQRTGKPKDKNCDGLDALRYWCMDRAQVGEVGIIILGEDDNDSSNHPSEYGLPDNFKSREYDYLND